MKDQFEKLDADFIKQHPEPEKRIKEEKKKVTVRLNTLVAEALKLF